MIGRGPPLRTGAPVSQPGVSVVRVIWGHESHIVALSDELIRKGLDMTTDPTRIRVRVRRDQSYAHQGILTESPDRVRARFPKNALSAARRGAARPPSHYDPARWLRSSGRTGRVIRGSRRGGATWLPGRSPGSSPSA